MADLPKTARLIRVGEAFRPAAPVDDLDLFAGRDEQRDRTIEAVSQIGRHIALYGQRGVGKTSLARVLSILLGSSGQGFRTARVNCHTETTFLSLWTEVFDALGIESSDISPGGVRNALEGLGQRSIIVIDELDRVEDDDSLTRLADTIKALSDNAVPSTLVLVGVAPSIDGLIGEHQSIVRNLEQIEMPRMEPRELRSILEKGAAHCELIIDQPAQELIIRLSEGLPHYTHLLAYHAATRAVKDDRSAVTLGDVKASLPRAVSGHTIENEYVRAIRSSQPQNLYREVLLACAVAPKDKLGYFTSGQVRDPLEVIVGRRLDIPAFAKHMKEFQSDDRGPTLWREGKPKGYSYRFADPMLQPYIVLASLEAGVITDEQLDQLRVPFSESEAETETPAHEDGRLF